MASNLFSSDGFFVAGCTPSAGALLCESMDTGVAAAGSTQGTATAIVSNITVLTSVPASSGVVLPAGVTPGVRFVVLNNTATAATVYPPVGGTLNGGSANAGITVAAASGGVPGKAVWLQTAALTYING
jgi:hypothetical protein